MARSMQARSPMLVRVLGAGHPLHVQIVSAIRTAEFTLIRSMPFSWRSDDDIGETIAMSLAVQSHRAHPAYLNLRSTTWAHRI